MRSILAHLKPDRIHSTAFHSSAEIVRKVVGITITPRKGSTSNIKSCTSRVSFRTKQNSSSFPVRDSFLLWSCFPDTTRVLAQLSDRGVSILTGCVSRVALSLGAAGLRRCSVERCNPNKKPVCWCSSIQTGVLGPVYSCESLTEVSGSAG